MKVIRKINRGAALTLIVFLGIVVYLICMGISDMNTMKNLEPICKDALAMQTKYSMLPESYRVSSKKISDVELESYINKMNKDVDTIFDGKAAEYMKKEFKTCLEAQSIGAYSVQDLAVKFDSIVGFEVDEDSVRILIRYNDIQYVVFGDGKPTSQENMVEQTMIFKKDESGKWKITYTNFVADFVDESMTFDKEGMLYENNFAN